MSRTRERYIGLQKDHIFAQFVISIQKVFLIEIFNYTELDVIYSGDRVQNLGQVVQQNNSGIYSEGCCKTLHTLLFYYRDTRRIEEVAVVIVVLWPQ